MKLAVFGVLLLILPFQAAGSCVGKNVKVWVADGKALTGDGRFKPDPYVVVKIGNNVQKTDVIHGNANPSWWEKLVFKKVPTDVMQIFVHDADKGKRADDHLGTCRRKMVSKGKKDVRAIKCTMNDKKGLVYLYYKCV